MHAVDASIIGAQLRRAQEALCRGIKGPALHFINQHALNWVVHGLRERHYKTFWQRAQGYTHRWLLLVKLCPWERCIMALHIGTCCGRETAVSPPCKSCDGGGKKSPARSFLRFPASSVEGPRKTPATCAYCAKGTRRLHVYCVRKLRRLQQTCHSQTGPRNSCFGRSTDASGRSP